VLPHSIKTGLSFGLTSGIITTLGLIVGLHAGTHSKLAVVGGIAIVAIADALSDALGIHIAEEAENKHTERQIWESTIATFVSKFIFASVFILPLVLLELATAILVSVIGGLCLLSILSFIIAREQQVKPAKVIAEHVLIALVVIFVTHHLGDWIASTLG